MLIFILHPAGVTANSGEVWAADNGKTFPSENKGYLISKKQGINRRSRRFNKTRKMQKHFSKIGKYKVMIVLHHSFAGKQHYQKR